MPVEVAGTLVAPASSGTDRGNGHSLHREPWKLAVGEVYGEPVVIVVERGADTSTPHSAIRLDVVGEQIERVVDYIHCP